MKRLSIITLVLLFCMAGLSYGDSLQNSASGFRNIFRLVDILTDILGTANQIVVTDNGDGTITLSTPQDIDTGATPTFDDTAIEGADPELTIQNTTEEDADDGREGIVRFKGEQSGGEVTTLAMLKASHNGAADDEKGKLEVYINDTNDGDTPTLLSWWDETKKFTHTGAALFQNSANSTTGFQVLDQDGGTSVFNVDTTNERASVGVDAPDYTLQVAGTIASGFTGTDGGLAAVSTGNAITALIRANGVTFINGGNVGFGTTTPDTIVDVTETAADTVVTISTYDNDATELPELNLRKADNTEASPALVDDNDVLGVVSFSGHDGSGFHEGARIEGRIDGTPSDGTDMPTELTFWTTPDASATAVEAMSIKPDATTALTSIESLSGSGVSNRIPVTSPMMNYIPGAYYRETDDKWQYEGTGAADQRYTLQSPTRLLVDVDDTMYLISSQTDYDLSVAATWDTTAGTDYTVAANRAGVDFYIYAIQPASGTTPLIEVSDNSSAPDGYTTANSRKIGGFHCLCVAVGTIGGHTLTDFVAGDILPESVWDYDHRPVSEPEGMVYSEGADIWVDIYLISGTGGSTASAYGGTISDTRDWMDFCDDVAAVKKRLLWDYEFSAIAAGSNEETNNAASADPVTTGGNSDTAGRRMISDIGVEDACGAMWQWLLDTSYRYDAGDHTHTTTITHKGAATGSAVSKDQAETNFNAVLGSGADETVNTSSSDPEPAWAYYNLAGSKGSFYRQGTYGTVQLLGGAAWAAGANSGSRARLADYYRWKTATDVGGRGASEPR